MVIAPDVVVCLRYCITDPQDEVLDAGDEPLEYLQGRGEFFESIERALEGRAAGYEETFHLEPEDAFGDYDADLVRIVERSALPEVVEPGMQFEGIPDETESAVEDAGIYTVTDVTDEVAVLDGNHPLAGRALRVWVKIDSVRPATEDELSHGHAGAVPGLIVVEGHEGNAGSGLLH